MFSTSKNVFVFQNYSKISKTNLDLQKMFEISNNIRVLQNLFENIRKCSCFQKMFVHLKKGLRFQKMFNNLKSCMCFLKMFTFPKTTWILDFFLSKLTKKLGCHVLWVATVFCRSMQYSRCMQKKTRNNAGALMSRPGSLSPVSSPRRLLIDRTACVNYNEWHVHTCVVALGLFQLATVQHQWQKKTRDALCMFVC